MQASPQKFLIFFKQTSRLRDDAMIITDSFLDVKFIHLKARMLFE